VFASVVPAGQLVGVHALVHQQVLLAVPLQPSSHSIVFDPYDVSVLDNGEQLQLVAGVHGGGGGLSRLQQPS